MHEEYGTEGLGLEFSNIQTFSRKKGAKPVLLSFAQERLWFLNQLNPGNPVYNIPNAVRLTGSLNTVALEQSINEILRRHSSLRTTFTIVDGQPIQVIAPTITFTLPMVDLQGLPETEWETEVQQQAIKVAQQTFNLTVSPPWHITLFRLGEEEHLLLLVTNLIISDALSTRVFIQEMVTLYEAFSTGKPSSLLELSNEYVDFAYWQRQWLKSEVLDSLLAYWKQQLSGSPPLLQLPTDKPRPPVQTFQGTKQSFVLSKSLSNSLQELSQREEANLFVTLLAAFKILLYRYTEQEDILVGSPSANRNQIGTERMIGLFVNTLILRTNLSGNPSFRELLKRVRKVVLEAYAYQSLPFEKLVEELHPEQSMSYTPLFQVMFEFQNAAIPVVQLSSLSVSPVEVHNGTTQFDLTLSLVNTETELVGTLEYSTDLFESSTITRMLVHFQTLLEGLVANPDQPISDLPLLTVAERDQILVEWNDTHIDYSNNLCIHQLFEAHAKRIPDAIAVICEDEQLTYQELDCRANQLAHYLRKLGVRSEVSVGIFMERSLDMAIGLLGVFKAGGACLLLDIAYPQERLTFMLEETQVPVILTQKRFVKEISKHCENVVYLDQNRDYLLQESTESLVSGVTGENLAFIIYTSGSTGRPKGVMVSHLAWSRDFWGEMTNYELTEADRHLLKSNNLHIEFFWPLWVGGRVIIASPGRDKDSAYLVKLIAKHKITVFAAVPSLLRIILEEPEIETCKYLRHVFVGGEILPVTLQERFFECLDADLHYVYGQTETAMTAVSNCQRGRNQGAILIGRPIANTNIYLLDSHLQLVPIGIPGELYVGGTGLALGYLKKPELSADKFISNPFSKDPNARLCKTGDVARYLPDGNIEFLGRLDHQVKIRGFRIELEEIEAVLLQHPVVQETVVITREDVPGDKRLVAYVVPNQEQAPKSNDLRRFLKQKLPDYMMPSSFIMLDALPLTPNGKVDRRTLPAPDQSRTDLAGTFVAPRTPIEQQLADIWVSVLIQEPVGIHNNFFELGGHSLLATQVMSRLRQAFSVKLPLRTLFESPTVAELAEQLEIVLWAAQSPQTTLKTTASDREEIDL